MHNTPRWDREFRSVSSEIPADFADYDKDGSDVRKWMEGVGMQTAIELGIGFGVCLILWTVLPIALCRSWCQLCGCCKRDPRASLDRPKRSSKCARVLVWVAGICFILGTIPASMYFTNKIDSDITDSRTVFDSIASLFQNASDVSTNLITSTNSIVSATEALESNTDFEDYREEFDAIKASATSASAALTTLVNVTTTVTDDIHKAKDGSQHANEYQRETNWSWIGVQIGFVLTFILSTLAYAPCRIVHKSVTCVGLICISVTWLLASVLFFTSLVTSDICYSPDATLTRIADGVLQVGKFNDGNTANVAVETADYYFTECLKNPSDPVAAGIVANATTGYQEIESGHLAVLSIIGEINANTFLNSTKKTELLDAIYPLSNATLGALHSANGTLEVLSCRNVRGVWVQVLNLVCTDAVNNSIIPLWATLTAATVFMSLMLLASIPLCWTHPSESEDDSAGYLGSVGTGSGAPSVEMWGNTSGVSVPNPAGPSMGGGVTYIPATDDRASRVGRMGASGYQNAR